MPAITPMESLDIQRFYTINNSSTCNLKAIRKLKPILALIPVREIQSQTTVNMCLPHNKPM